MRTEILDKILDLEWNMFSQVRSARPAACQQSPRAFRAIRGSLFALWNDALLASYLDDLKAAGDAGRNLLTEKYARMDGLISVLSSNPIIEVIVDIEAAWQRELRDRFPALYRRCCRGTDLAEDGSDFAVYLHSELETYGYDTVEKYYEHVKLALDDGRNLAIDALSELVRQAGYADIGQAESVLSTEQRA